MGDDDNKIIEVGGDAVLGRLELGEISKEFASLDHPSLRASYVSFVHASILAVSARNVIN